ncbi:MAG: LysR family transcriptional regulator [Pseudomonadota bacterium]
MVQDFGTLGLPALRSFSTVARLGGISAAAERLGIAKSGVSRHVALLEAHFGVKLLERGARSVKLTPIGARLHQRIGSILAEVDLLDDIAREESRGVSGLVSIAATPEFGGLVAKTLFPIIQAKHPNLKLVMRAAYEFEDMQDPSTDIAIRVGTFQDDRLVALELGAFRAWVVASPDFLSKHAVETPQDLKSTPCLLFRGDRTRTTWTLHRNEEKIVVDVAGNVGVQSFTILMDLAIEGQGVALIPEFMLESALRSGELVHCLPEYTSRAFSVFLTFRPGARRIGRLEATISLAEEHIRGLLSNDREGLGLKG